MPIYDYTCSTCRRVTEVIHGINDHGPKFCPECGAEGTMTKKFVAPTVHFKGSGWAKKDRSTARASRTKDDGSATPDGDAKSSSEGTASDSGATGTGAKKTEVGTTGDPKGRSSSSSDSSSDSSSSSTD